MFPSFFVAALLLLVGEERFSSFYLFFSKVVLQNAVVQF